MILTHLPQAEAELNAATHELMRSLSPVSYQFKLIHVFAAILNEERNWHSSDGVGSFPV